MLRSLFIVLIALCLTGCASTKFEVLDINALSSDRDNNGAFVGLERLAQSAPNSRKKRVNIMYLHGIGYVENPEDAPLANAFITGVADAYGQTVEEKAVASQCGRARKDEDVELSNSITITEVKKRTYKTTLPGSTLSLDELVCMDRQVLPVDSDIEYVIYRVFWDDIFWEALQRPHVGQDAIGQNETGMFASLRTKYNGRLKDKLVNYGFSDAVLYLGPAGEQIRNAVRGAMCSAALDASGFGFEQQGDRVNHIDICQIASLRDIETDPFAFVTESLGSKIAFDIMRDAMTDGRGNVYDDMIKGTQFFMLANQVPLLSLSDISLNDRVVPEPYADEERPTIIAMSEINDFLSYELVPFYKQLLERSDRGDSNALDMSVETERNRLIDLLGFNIVDMRVQFSGPVFPFVGGFVDPLFAHNGHVKQPELVAYMLCGAKSGQLHVENCRGLSSDALRGKNLRRKIPINENIGGEPLKGEAAKRQGK
ncbi:hypothetical protein [Litorimonas sp. WD9-15]|uniref:hypothetical protein n=1 Tax=Litorimonas sp. WD9-15 TaxID=3418716 RepID=UPI003D0845BF